MSGRRGNTRHANGWRRQQVVARVLAAYDTCHLCGRPVDKSLPPGLPGSPEVDEIIPVSKGGSPYLFSTAGSRTAGATASAPTTASRGRANTSNKHSNRGTRPT